MRKKLFYIILILTVGSVLIYFEVPKHIKIPPVIVQVNNPSPQDGALFGSAVDGLGDINGDGVGDLVVGAYGADKVYVLSGADPNSVIRTITDPDGASGFWFGYSVRGVGDINGDGIEDIAVGSPGDPSRIYPSPIPDLPTLVIPLNNSYVHRRSGRMFVFSGASGEKLLDFGARESDLAISIGWSIASLGDINDDNIPDIAVSDVGLQSSYSFEKPIVACVYAVSGSDGDVLWKTLEPQTWLGSQRIQSFGFILKELGDVTWDGKMELLVSAPYAEYTPDPDTSLMEGIGWVLNGANGDIRYYHRQNTTNIDGNLFSWGAGAVGYQDEDLAEDYIFGAPSTSAIELHSGATGKLLLTIPAPPDGSGDSFFGASIAKVGDVDGDGLDDFWVSATNEGKIYLLNTYGEVLIEVDDPAPPVSSYEGFGYRMSATSDLNGDDAADLIVGKPSQSVNGFNEAGAVFLVLGAHT